MIYETFNGRREAEVRATSLLGGTALRDGAEARLDGGRAYTALGNDAGAVAGILKREEGDLYEMLFLSSEETKKGNRTHIFKDTPATDLPLVEYFGNHFRKPRRALPVRRCMLPGNAEEVFRFVKNKAFGGVWGDIILRSGDIPTGLDAETAFDTEGDGPVATRIILPSTLAEVSGVEVRDGDTYVGAYNALLGGTLTEAHLNALRVQVSVLLNDYLSRCVFYEFLRVETYSHLIDTIDRLRSIYGLGERWGLLAEVRSLWEYVSFPMGIGITARRDLREVAEYLDAPYERMLRGCIYMDEKGYY